MNEIKKIAFVIPSLSAGGMERVMSEIINYITKKPNIETHLIVLTNNEFFYSIDKNVQIYQPPFSFNPRFRFYYTMKTLFFLRNRLRTIKPFSVLSFGETYNSFVLLATWGIKTKVYISDRSKPDKDWGYFHNNLRKILYKKAAGIISQTSYSKNFLIKETQNKNIKIIPNPIDLNKYQTSLKKENVILNVGRLISTKRIDILLDCFSKIENQNWQLWIVGDGPLRKYLEDIAKKLDISNNVKFWGTQNNIAPFYLKSKIFAFTSFSEGFPNALLEAIAAGLPTIAFNCIAGPSDLVKNGENGFLISQGDTETYLQKLKELIENETLRNTFSENAIEIAQSYKLEKIGEEYLNFLLS